MTEMAMQRRRDGKRRAPREKATEKGRDNGEPVEKTPTEKRGERENQRRGPRTEIERGRPRDTQRRKAERLLPDPGGRRARLAPSPTRR